MNTSTTFPSLSESLPVGTQTKAMGLCVIDGCYLLDVVSGVDPYTMTNPADTAAYVVCGAVGDTHNTPSHPVNTNTSSQAPHTPLNNKTSSHTDKPQ